MSSEPDRAGADPRIVAFGEALWDLLPSGAVLGGAPLNFTYRCTSLGEQAALLSRLGADSLGRQAADRMADLAMDSRWLQWDSAHETGRVEVRVDGAGNPDYTIVPEVAYDYIEMREDLLRLVERCECLCFGTLAQRCPVSRATLAGLLAAFRGRWLLVDVNLRRGCYTTETVRSSVHHARLLKMSETEIAEVAGACGLACGPIPDMARELVRSADLDLCVVTLGEQGCFAAASGGEAVYEPGYEVRLADTCGSGDAFTAALLHILLRGGELRRACRYANALGALVASQSGATGPVAPGELDAFVDSGPRRPLDRRFREFGDGKG